jgi:hypothetical protein
MYIEVLTLDLSFSTRASIEVLNKVPAVAGRCVTCHSNINNISYVTQDKQAYNI